MTELELQIDTDGTVRTIYDEAVLKELSEIDTLKSIHRGSLVEWEQSGDIKGWTVRSALDPNYAIRIGYDDTEEKPTLLVSVDPKNPLMFFKTREDALLSERVHFWKLLGR